MVKEEQKLYFINYVFLIGSIFEIQYNYFIQVNKEIHYADYFFNSLSYNWALKKTSNCVIVVGKVSFIKENVCVAKRADLHRYPVRRIALVEKS